jgi:hypothetical protein
MPFTSIRPTYIYGPLNYNPLEEWFFERLDQVHCCYLYHIISVHLPVLQVVSCAVACIAMLLLGCVPDVADCYEALVCS